MFETLSIAEDLVEIALDALQTHSQNHVHFNPETAINISQEHFDMADEVLRWMKLPFNTKSSQEDY